jgi:hypothetical protein
MLLLWDCQKIMMKLTSSHPLPDKEHKNTNNIIMTNNNSAENTIMTNDYTMTDENYIAEIEEGVMEAIDPTDSKGPTNTLSKGRNRLSFVSQKYDVDGDGVLDAAELASRLHLLSRCVSFVRVPQQHSLTHNT